MGKNEFIVSTIVLKKNFAKQMITRKGEGIFPFIKGFTMIYLLLLYGLMETFQQITNFSLKCQGGYTLSCFIKYIIEDRAPS